MTEKKLKFKICTKEKKQNIPAFENLKLKYIENNTETTFENPDSELLIANPIVGPYTMICQVKIDHDGDMNNYILDLDVIAGPCKYEYRGLTAYEVEPVE